MNLTEKPDVMKWRPMHYAFVEKVGPFQKTAPEAWSELARLMPSLLKQSEITGQMALYKMAPNRMTYRAGFALSAKPAKLPKGLRYQRFTGGKYSRFVLTGPYSELPRASGRVFQIVDRARIKLRDDFCIEHYANDPQTTPESQLVTEILIPTH